MSDETMNEPTNDRKEGPQEVFMERSWASEPSRTSFKSQI